MAKTSRSPRSEPVTRQRRSDGQFVGDVTPTGFGSLKHRPKVFPNPDSFVGRREAARQRYYDSNDDE